MNGRGLSRLLMILLGVVAAVSIGGLLTTLVLSFAGDKYDSYGQLEIPGSGELHLPAGEVLVSFHVHGYGGRGLRLPKLNFDITPPAGSPDPTVTEDFGATISVNDDARRRVWVMQVPAEGNYRIVTGGQVNGYIEPQLAFGHARSLGAPIWVFAALSMVSVDLGIAAWWFRRRRRGVDPETTGVSAEPYVPTDQGVRLDQLKTIAALRDSGALTEDEFDAEKRRILDGH